MKKILLVILSAIIVSTSYGAPELVCLSVHYNDDDYPAGHSHPRTPIQPPTVYIDEYTLSFDESCNGCTLRIVNAEDEVEYTTIITSGMLVLPSTLEGDYEIQIISGYYCFYGDIEL